MQTNQTNQLQAIIAKTKQHRLMLAGLFFVVLLVTYGCMCLVPRYYTSTRQVVLEQTLSPISGSFGAVAGVLGTNGDVISQRDAIATIHLENVVTSPRFLRQLLDCPVEANLTDYNGSYMDYLEQLNKRSWKYLEPDERKGKAIKKLKHDVSTSYDKINDVLTIHVNANDPKISAMLADQLVVLLNQYMNTYRQKKIQKSEEHYAKSLEEVRQHYMEAQLALQEAELAARSGKTEDLAKLALCREEASILTTQLRDTELQHHTVSTRMLEDNGLLITLTASLQPTRPAGPHRTLTAGLLAILVLAGAILLISRKEIWDMLSVAD